MPTIRVLPQKNTSLSRLKKPKQARNIPIKTILNCKDAYETKLDTVKAYGAMYDNWTNEFKLKCDDGNKYTIDEMFDLTSKQNPAEQN